ncbi:RNA polymerase sigma factor [Sphingomonas sp. URHD0057]|uniref:RNA polymerase sigma factor n=1 Tax=Sphingomonas sp. URHD0057 TaxID=1380389 RepID=UPI00048F14EE|nr:RNA polymerase sigma factor [Sphingomonas sp. URHD0057]
MDQSASFDVQIAAMLPRLRRFAHSLSRNRDDADDLAQSTVERALRSRSQWQRGTRLDSWMFKIMRNQWIDGLRSRTRKERFEAPPEAAERVAAEPEGGLEASVELHRAMDAMERLPEEQREIVALILVEGFGYQETADMLGLPMGTVASRLARGRTTLLELMGAR